MANILITGGSRGLGHGFSLGVPDPSDTVWLVSRGRPKSLDKTDGVTRHWVQADLTLPESSDQIAAVLYGQALDLLLYNAGVWEHHAFSANYDFAAVELLETQQLINVNLVSMLACVRALLPNLRKARAAKIVLIGSTSGMENNRQPEVAYNASKFGVRGLAQALRQSLRKEKIAITCINPGSICAGASAPAYELGREAVTRRYGSALLPMHDLVALVRCLMQLSTATNVTEISVPAMDDEQA
jgi:short-subunit dehydrogenase